MLKQHAGWMCFSVRGPHTTVMNNEGEKIPFFLIRLKPGSATKRWAKYPEGIC